MLLARPENVFHSVGWIIGNVIARSCRRLDICIQLTYSDIMFAEDRRIKFVSHNLIFENQTHPDNNAKFLFDLTIVQSRLFSVEFILQLSIDFDCQ